MFYVSNDQFNYYGENSGGAYKPHLKVVLDSGGAYKPETHLVNVLIRLTTIKHFLNTNVCHHQKGGDCWNKICLTNITLRVGEFVRTKNV